MQVQGNMDSRREEKLVIELCEQLRKEGGVCKLESIATFSKQIRSLLAERKLLSFLQGQWLYVIIHV